MMTHCWTTCCCLPPPTCPLQVTKGSDVYSFGVLMWSFITGQVPYVIQGDDVLPNKQFPTFPPTAPAQYVDLAELCLRRDPHERPTFLDIAQSLMTIFSAELGHEGADGSVGIGPPHPGSPSLLSGREMQTTTASHDVASEPDWDPMHSTTLGLGFGASRSVLASSFLGGHPAATGPSVKPPPLPQQQ